MASDTPQYVQEDEEYEIDLYELFQRLLASWKLLAALTILGTLISFLVTSFLITPKYQATSTIYVLSPKDSAVDISDLQIGSALTADYQQVFEMWEVHEEVIDHLNLPYTYDQIQSMIKVTNVTNTRMLNITVTSTNAREAADIANEYATVASSFIAETMSTERPNVVSAALVPSRPYTPKLRVNLLIGAAAGLFVSCLIVFVRMMLDDKIKTSEDIRKHTGLPTLAVIPIDTQQGFHGRPSHN